MNKHWPMNFHFIEHCLKKFYNKNGYAPNKSFDYSVVTLSQKTLTKLNEEERSFLRKLGSIKL